MSKEGKQVNSAQEEFDKTYISSSEICADLGVERSAVWGARRRGMLPNPIIVNGGHITLWKREEAKPFIEQWREKLKTWKSYRV